MLHTLLLKPVNHKFAREANAATAAHERSGSRALARSSAKAVTTVAMMSRVWRAHTRASVFGDVGRAVVFLFFFLRFCIFIP